MSEVKLNLKDAQQIRHGTVHGSIADRCVAALSAIAELEEPLGLEDGTLPAGRRHASLGSEAVVKDMFIST